MLVLAPNTILQDRYEIVRQLGQGGMGAVYEATDRRFGSTVALKQTLVAGDALRRAFEREARLLNTLQHAGLPHVIDYFFEGDGQFLVMQYIPGDDLGQMLRRRAEPFPVGNVVTWADQLLDLLDYLHTHEPPIIHRDIKPENLKLTRRGNIILLDFGLAKGLAEQAAATNASSVVGYTPNYAPLEQIRGTGTDERGDLYALAATLFHLVTMRLPPDAVARAESFVNGQPDPLRPANEVDPRVPARVASVLHAALALRRDDRPRSAAAMREALRDATRATVPDAPEVSTYPSAPGPAVTVPTGRPTEPESQQTVPAISTAVPVQSAAPTYQPTYPATYQVTAPPPPSGTGAKIVLALASVAAVVVLGVGAVLVYIYAFSNPRSTPAPAPYETPRAPQSAPRATPDAAPVSHDTPPSTSAPAAAPRITATATSVREPIDGNTYGPEMALDGRPSTAWVEGAEAAGIGESITLTLSTPARVSRLRIEPGYFKSPTAWAKNNRLARARITLSDGRTIEAKFDDEMREQAVAIGGGAITSITVTIEDAYLGGDDLDTAISEIAVDMQ
jgi:serine/threonine protein kinase